MSVYFLTCRMAVNARTLDSALKKADKTCKDKKDVAFIGSEEKFHYTGKNNEPFARYKRKRAT